MYGRDYHEWRECEDALESVLTVMPSDPQARDYLIKTLAGGRKPSAREAMEEYHNLIRAVTKGQIFHSARCSFLP